MNKKPQLTVEILAAIEWEFDGDEDIDFKFCDDWAHFTHTDACEFIIYIGPEPMEKGSVFQATLKRMREWVCSEDFIEAITEAAKIGALRVLIYA